MPGEPLFESFRQRHPDVDVILLPPDQPEVVPGDIARAVVHLMLSEVVGWAEATGLEVTARTVWHQAADRWQAEIVATAPHTADVDAIALLHTAAGALGWSAVVSGDDRLQTQTPVTTAAVEARVDDDTLRISAILPPLLLPSDPREWE